MCDQYDRAAAVLVPKYARRTNAADASARYAIRWPTHLPKSVAAATPTELTTKLAARLRDLAARRKLGGINLDRVIAA